MTNRETLYVLQEPESQGQGYRLGLGQDCSGRLQKSLETSNGEEERENISPMWGPSNCGNCGISGKEQLFLFRRHLKGMDIGQKERLKRMVGRTES